MFTTTTCAQGFCQIKENQGNELCLTNIREKSGDSASARDDQENSRKNACLCFFNQLIYAKKARKKTHSAHNEIVGFIFHDGNRAHFTQEG